MKPASPEMIELGCTCDQEENRNGAGIEGFNGCFILIKTARFTLKYV